MVHTGILLYFLLEMTVTSDIMPCICMNVHLAGRQGVTCYLKRYFLVLLPILMQAQGAYRFLKINLRHFLRHFKTNFSKI